MSSRREQKEQAKAKRQAAEAEQAASEQRKRKLLYSVGGAVLLAAIVVVVLVAVNSGGNDGDGGNGLQGVSETNALFSDVPQRGETLGNPNAKVEMLDFSDMQCPFCAEYTVKVLPTIVDRYVRTGRMKITHHLLTFIGPQSLDAAKYAIAAGLQNKSWNYTNLFYHNQGPEGSGYANKEFLTNIGDNIPGLDVAKVQSQLNAGPVTKDIGDSQQLASSLGVDSTPSFFIKKNGGQPQRLEVESLTPEEFTKQIDAAIGES